MKEDVKRSLVSKLKELFSFLYWSDDKHGKLMIKEIDDTAVMVRFVMPYMGWNTEIRTTIHGNLGELVSTSSDIVPLMGEIKVVMATARTYTGKPIEAEYTINPDDGAGMSKLLDQTFKQFEDKVRREVYDMKKAGGFVDDSINDSDSWETC